MMLSRCHFQILLTRYNDVKMVETAYILNLLFSKFNIIDIKINETSTEGIIKNIYEEK